MNIAKAKDLTGDVYGDFTVKEMLYGYRIVRGKPRTYCKCIDSNNNEYIIRADALRSGTTKYVKGATKAGKANDISGKKFGHLKVLYPTDKRSANSSIVWACKCDCGNFYEVPSGNLVRGHTRSCGCHHKSKYEEFIESYLNSIKVSFVDEKRFDNCRNKSGTDMLPFDFYIPEYNLLIEYDGQHHFEPIKGWGGRRKI